MTPGSREAHEAAGGEAVPQAAVAARCRLRTSLFSSLLQPTVCTGAPGLQPTQAPLLKYKIHLPAARRPPRRAPTSAAASRAPPCPCPGGSGSWGRAAGSQ
jgi:hypothetical protein